nr:uncharacterized protein LOC113724359 [Coffea arabica]
MERDMERDTELAYLLQPPIEVVLERLSPYPLPLRLFAVKESVVVLPPPRDLTGFRLFINSFSSPKPGSLDFEVEIQPRYYRNGECILASCTPNLAERRLPQSPLLPLHPSLEEMKLLMWNVRGTGSSAFRDHLLQHINTHKPGIVTVVETRLSGSRAVEVCESLPFTNFRIQDANTFKGDCGSCGTGLRSTSNLSPTLSKPSMQTLRHVLSNFQQVQVKHIYREANKGADALAKLGEKLLCPFSLLDSCPLSLGSILSDDLRGICFPRYIAKL